MACISGSQAISQAAGLIACGQADTAIAGGTESLSNIPILLKRPMRHKLMEMRRLKNPVDWIRWVSGLRPGYFLPGNPGDRGIFKRVDHGPELRQALSALGRQPGGAGPVRFEVSSTRLGGDPQRSFFG